MTGFLRARRAQSSHHPRDPQTARPRVNHRRAAHRHGLRTASFLLSGSAHSTREITPDRRTLDTSKKAADPAWQTPHDEKSRFNIANHDGLFPARYTAAKHPAARKSIMRCVLDLLPPEIRRQSNHSQHPQIAQHQRNHAAHLTPAQATPAVTPPTYACDKWSIQRHRSRAACPPGKNA